MANKKTLRTIIFSLLSLSSYLAVIYYVIIETQFIYAFISITFLYIFIHYIIIESEKKILYSTIALILTIMWIELLVIDKISPLTSVSIITVNIWTILLITKIFKEIESRKKFETNVIFNAGKWIFVLMISISIGINFILKNQQIQVSCKNLYGIISSMIDFTPTSSNLTEADKIEIKKMVVQWLTTSVKWSVDAWIEYSIKKTWLDWQFLILENLLKNLDKNKLNKNNTKTENNIKQPQPVKTENKPQDISTEVKKNLNENQQLQELMKQYNISENDLWIDQIVEETTNQIAPNSAPQNSNKTQTPQAQTSWIQEQNKNISSILNSLPLDKETLKKQIIKSIWLDPKLENKKICSIITQSIQEIYAKPFVKYYSMILISLWTIIALKLVLWVASILNIIFFKIFQLAKIYQIQTVTQEVDKII